MSATDSKLAKRLAVLFAEAGEGGPSQVKPVLEKILSGKSSSETRQFLKIFEKAVQREFHKDTLTIEAPGGASDELITKLTSQFQKDHPRKIHAVSKDNPELIAGVKVRLGDTVYDASIQGKLAALSASIH